jgi:hypothetical protein
MSLLNDSDIPELEYEDVDNIALDSPVSLKYWYGGPPEFCDMGGEPITDFFVDGKSKMGPWGFMCASCHSRYGYGLGTGKGQSYKKQPDGRWLKVGG